MTEIQALLARLVLAGKSRLVRKISKRKKVHAVPKKDGTGEVFFIYDRTTKTVDKLLKQEKAVFAIGEVVFSLVNHRFYQSKVLCVIPRLKTPLDYIDEFPDHRGNRVFTLTTLHDTETLIVSDLEGKKLFWLSINNVRKLTDIDEISQKVLLRPQAARSTNPKKAR